MKEENLRFLKSPSFNRRKMVSLERLSWCYAKTEKALKEGRIKRAKVCENCGKRKKLHAHHPNHSWPLRVIWLCHPCHASVSGKKGGILGGTIARESGQLLSAAIEGGKVQGRINVENGHLAKVRVGAARKGGLKGGATNRKTGWARHLPHIRWNFYDPTCSFCERSR